MFLSFIRKAGRGRGTSSDAAEAQRVALQPRGTVDDADEGNRRVLTFDDDHSGDARDGSQPQKRPSNRPNPESTTQPAGAARGGSGLVPVTSEKSSPSAVSSRSGGVDGKLGATRSRTSDRASSSVMVAASRRYDAALRLHRRATDAGLEEHAVQRPQAHKYVFRRPRALQVRYMGRDIEIGDEGVVDVGEIRNSAPGDSEAVSRTSTRSTSTGSGAAEERSTDSVEVQRERLDLFIDLLWAGIVSNISENFYNTAFRDDAAVGIAIVEFITLFLPAWGMWSRLQQFLSNYYMDDFAQRIVIIWYLILGLVFGNNAPFILAPDDGAETVILTFLVAALSLRATELVYSIWLPWLRRGFLVHAILTLPLIGLWTGAQFSGYWTRTGIVLGAVVYERLVWIIELSPVWDMLHLGGVRSTLNWTHTIRRWENFFIIVLGEGVFLLIRQSPLGRGYSLQLGRGVMALMIYFALHWIYFNGDQSKKAVHPVHRRWYIKALWFLWQIPLFMAIVLLSSGMLYLIDYTPEGITNGVPLSEGGSDDSAVSASAASFGIARTTAMVSLAVSLLSMLVLALLSKPLDAPDTLVVNSRYVRLAPRAAAACALAGAWAAGFGGDATGVIGTMLFCTSVPLAWEWHASLERGGGLFEPRPAAKPARGDLVVEEEGDSVDADASDGASPREDLDKREKTGST